MVDTRYKVKEMDEKIQLLRKTAEELMVMGGEIEAVKKNLVRLLASTAMLELNISDVKDLLNNRSYKLIGPIIKRRGEPVSSPLPLLSRTA